VVLEILTLDVLVREEPLIRMVTTVFQPDTCDCVVSYNKNIQWVETIQTCRLHKNLRGQNLLDIITIQQHKFNFAFGSQPTDAQLELMQVAKTVNKLRIRTENLTNFDEHLPFEKTLTFFQNLRRVLRI